MAESGDKYILRQFTLDDYQQYSSWWLKDKVNPPPLSSLPNIGLVSGNMKAVGFLANTDTDFGIITFWHANINNSNKESYMAINRIIEGLIYLADSIYKTKVFCYTNNRGMIKILESHGFINNEGHLIKEF